VKKDQASNVVERQVQDLIDICPHCGAKAHIIKLWNDYHSFENGNIEFYVIFRCKPCKKLILKTCIFEQNSFTSDENVKFNGWDEKFPVTFDDELSQEEKKYIPDQVLSDYQEALKCKSIGANRASCSMFRR